MTDRKEYLKRYYIEHRDQNRLRSVWNSMIQRCKKGHKYYGDKGIKVCEHWHSFDNFKEWAMNNGYDKELTLDRIDGNRDYAPDNCRWATRKEQQRNTSYNVKLTYKGETHCISEWAEITGLSANAIRKRTKRNWDAEKILTTPVKINTRSINYGM